MLCRHKPYLDNLRIVLGSTSPQRQRLFRDILGLHFEAIGSSFAEDIDKAKCRSAADYCLLTTLGKIESLNRSLQFDYDLLICADTIVVTADEEVLEKPRDRAEAARMLQALSGRTCTVYSSCIISYRERGGIRGGGGGRVRTQVGTLIESTAVNFATLPDEDIAAYIDTNEPYTKSGGFGLQSLGGTLVEGIVGDYYNVEGFPCFAFARKLREMLQLAQVQVQAQAQAGQGDIPSPLSTSASNANGGEGESGGGGAGAGAGAEQQAAEEEEWYRLYAQAEKEMHQRRRAD